MNEEIRIEKVEVLGLEMQRWIYRSCTAEFAEGPDWTTLSFIESKQPGKGHATTLLTEAKKHYEAEGKRFGGSIALNPRMRAIYQRLGIKEYVDDSALP